jgi:hypothetical protein
MPWYRGVECKGCKQKLALQSVSGPDDAALDPPGSQGWAQAELTCPECRTHAVYERADSTVFRTLDPITLDPSTLTLRKTPN